MNPERYALVSEIVGAAQVLKGDKRSSYLEEACAGDPELRREVESILSLGLSENQEDAFSEERIEASRENLDDVARKTASPESEQAVHPRSAWVPEQIGPYRILERIGMGGMGIVYEAEQESPRRKVALKVLHPLFVTEETLRRFRQESELLGRLQHPGIAQIHEAGTFDLGRGDQPYFAMELVDGADLRTYCDRENLDIKDRLRLLAQVCDAVDHAHQSGIVHRDLKPENILVNRQGRPKVLDFGIAMSTERSTVLESMVTATGAIMGTLAYMSPEQVSGRSGNVDMRSDVYALGVLLFELLSGKLPYDVRKRSIADAARVIQEDEPTHLGECDTSFRGDLETITMKALEKETSRRYSMAAELADDIRRYLADQPIVARVPSSFYYLRKFAKRHKAVVGGVLATMLALVAGLVFSINFALDARRNAAETQWTAYTLGISAAQSSIITDPHGATGHLGRLPESLRNWEWHHLHAQLDASLARCKGEGIISSAAFLGDGTPVAALIQGGVVTLVDVNTGDVLKDFGSAPNLAFLSLSEDGAWLGGFDIDRQEISIWDVTEGLLVNRIPVPPVATFASCTFSNNGAPDGNDSRSIDTLGVLGIEVTDTIVWNHANADGKRAEHRPPVFGSERDVTVNHSLIQGLSADIAPGIIDVDPLFVNPHGPDGLLGTPDDDLRLQPDSPARLGDRVLGALPRPRTTDSLPGEPAPGMVTVYVDKAASGNNSGESWANAYTDLQSALTANHSQGAVRVLVAQGVYRPSPGRASTSDDPSFKPGDGMELYGGFPQGGSSLAARDPKRYETILSSDLNGDDAVTGDISDNSNCLVYCEPGSSFALDGFTLTRCQSAALFVDTGGSCSVTETTFLNNRGLRYVGAAIYCKENTDLSVRHSGFFGNVGPQSTILSEGRSSFGHCVFSGNKGESVFRSHLSGIWRLRFSSTGRFCYTLGGRRAGLLDVQSGQFSRFKDAGDAAFFGQDSTLVLGWNHQVDRINLQDGSTMKKVLRGATIFCLSMSPDGNGIAVGTGERVIHLLDGQLESSGATLSGHASHVTDVLFLQNNVLASASRDGTVRIWDLMRQMTTQTVIAGTTDGSLAYVAASPDRTQILSSSGNEVSLLNLEAGASRLLDGHSNYVYFATHSPDGTMIASYAYDHKLILWDACTGEPLATMSCDETRSLPQGLAFTPDGSRVIAMTPETYALWDVATGQRIRQTTTPGPMSDRQKQIKQTRSQSALLTTLFDEQGGGGARSVYRPKWTKAISVDGTLLIVGMRDGGIDIVARKDMEVLSTLEGPKTEIHAVTINADNTLIASADRESVIIWERASGREIARLGGLGGNTYCLDFSPDGTRVVTGGEDGVIRLWDTSSYKLAAELKGHGSYVHSVLFSPDGTQLVSASGDHDVRIWDTISRVKRLEQARAAKRLREKMKPRVDRLAGEHLELSRVAEILRGDASLHEEERRAALRVLLERTQAGREEQ